MFTSDRLQSSIKEEESSMFVSPEKEHSVVDTGSPSVVGNKDNVASADCMDSHWRTSFGADPDQNVDIVRQLVEFMSNMNEANGYYGTANDDDAFPSGGIEDFFGGAGGRSIERLGYPLSMCVQGDGYYFQLSEDDLRKVFGRYGEVRLIEVTGLGRDVAHVYYDQLGDAQNAIEDLNDKILKGVQGVLRVVWGLYKSPSTFTSPTMTTINEQQPQLPANGTGDFVYGKGLEGAVVDSVSGACCDDATLNRLLSELRNGSSSLNGDDELTENLRADSMATTAAISSRCTSQDNVFGSVHNNSGGGDELVDEKEKEEEGDNDDTRAEALQEQEVGSSTTGSPSRGLIRKFTCRFDIGIDNDREFQVARRIIGNKGSNMKRIVGLSNGKLRLRGQGSGYLEGTLRRESPDPLHLCISCVTREGYLAAVKETKTLLKRVYAEWRNFQIKRGRGDPGMIGIQMKEHFLTGPSPTIRGGGTQIFNTYSPRRFGSSSPVSEKKDLYLSRTTMRSKRH